VLIAAAMLAASSAAFTLFNTTSATMLIGAIPIAAT